MLSEEDSLEVLSWRDGKKFAGLQLVGGVDISFNKSNPDEACAIVVVLSFPQLQVSLSAACRVQLVTCSPTSPHPTSTPGGPHVLCGVSDARALYTRVPGLPRGPSPPILLS